MLLIAFFFITACEKSPSGLLSRNKQDFSECNLLMISLDTLRQDRLGAFGCSRPTSPFLDTLQRDSMICADVLAQSPSTVRSHRSVFTSQYVYRQIPQFPAPNETLAGLLSDLGMRTAGFVDGGLMHRNFGNHAGFQEYDDTGGGLAVIQSKAVQWLASHQEERFFLFMHTYDIHYPYTPPKPYSGMFLPEGAPGFDLDGKAGHEYYNSIPLTSSDYAYILGRYDGGIRYVDRMLADLFRELTRMNLRQRTIVVIFSDHGESLGERHYVGHNQLYDVQLKVPLFFCLPDQSGRIIPGPAENVDIIPTLLDLFHIPCRPEMQGKSLVSPMFDGMVLPNIRTRISERQDKSVRQDEEWKLIIRDIPEHDELYHVTDDPEEVTNQLSAYPAIAEQLRSAYGTMTQQTPDQIRAKSSQTMIHVPLMQQGSSESKLLDQLKTLGYME